MAGCVSRSWRRAAVERAWIEGRAIDLNDRQKTLNAKYTEKYRRLGVDPGATGGTRP